MNISQIAQRIKTRKLIFFVGAGISKDQPAGIPLAGEFVIDILDALSTHARSFPITQLKRRASDLPLEVFLQIVFRRIGDQTFRVFDLLRYAQPNRNHLVLGQLLIDQFVPAVVTVNFDDQIERAIGILLSGTKSQGDTISTDRIIKLHGSIEQGEEMIATLFQVGKGMAARERKRLQSLLRKYYCCFIGYRGNDIGDIVPVIRTVVENNIHRGIIWNLLPGETPVPAVRELLRRNRISVTRFKARDLFGQLSNSFGFQPMRPKQCTRSRKDSLLDWAKGLDRYAALQILGGVSEHLSEWDLAKRFYEESYRLARKRRTPRQVALSTYALIDPLRFLGHTSRAQQLAENAKGFFARSGDLPGLAGTLLSQAPLLFTSPESGLKTARSALGLFQVVLEEHHSHAGYACFWVGNTLKMMGRYREADNCLAGGLAHAKAAGDLQLQVGLIRQRAEVNKWIGNYGKAISLYEEALKIAIVFSSQRDVAWIYWGLADIYRLIGLARTARTHLNKAKKIFQQNRNRQGLFWVYECLSELERIHGRQIECRRLLRMAQPLTDVLGEIYLLLNHGELLRQDGKWIESAAEFGRALKLSKKRGFAKEIAVALLGLAEVHRMAKADCKAEYKEALKIFRFLPCHWGQFQCLVGLGLLSQRTVSLPLASLESVLARMERGIPHRLPERRLLTQIKSHGATRAVSCRNLNFP